MRIQSSPPVMFGRLGRKKAEPAAHPEDVARNPRVIELLSSPVGWANKIWHVERQLINGLDLISDNHRYINLPLSMYGDKPKLDEQAQWMQTKVFSIEGDFERAQSVLAELETHGIVSKGKAYRRARYALTDFGREVIKQYRLHIEQIGDPVQKTFDPRRFLDG